MRLGYLSWSLCLLIPVFVLSGCSILSQKDASYRSNRDSPLIAKTDRDKILERAVNCYMNGNCNDYYRETDRTTIADPMVRNAVVSDLLLVSDSNEKLWVLSVRNDIEVREVSLDIVGLLLSAAAAVTSPVSVAKVLTVGSTAAQGVNATWDKRYIAGKTIDTILNGVLLARRTAETTIVNNFTKSYGDYDLSAAIRDVVAYDELLTLETGTSAIETQTATSLDKANKELSAAQADTGKKTPGAPPNKGGN